MSSINTQIIISARDLASAQFRRVQGEVESTRREVSSLDMAMDGMGRTVAFLGGAAGLGLLTLSSGRAVVQLDRLEKSFKGLYGGDAVAAADEMAFVSRVADDLGSNLFSTAEAYKLVTAASKDTKLQGQGAREIFLGVSEASAVLGRSSEQTSGALLAISQMIGKGKVQAEEFRGQLGERLPVALQLASKAMNMTTQEFNAALESGEILAEDFLPKLARALRDEYSEAAREAARTDLGRAWERFTASGTELVATIDDISGASKAATDDINTLAEGVSGFARITKAMDLIQQGRLGFFQWASMSREELKSFMAEAETVEGLAAQIERLERKKAGLVYREERQEVQALIDELTTLREAKLKAGYVDSAAGITDTWLARDKGKASANERAAADLEKSSPPAWAERLSTRHPVYTSDQLARMGSRGGDYEADAEARAERLQQNLELERDFYDELAVLVGDDEEAQRAAIMRKHAVYSKVIQDEAALARWLAEEQLRASRDWSAGAILALRDIEDRYTDMADQAGGAITRAFDGATEALVDFVTTGEMNFKRFADSVIRDLARIAIQKTITGQIAGALGNMFTSGGTTAPAATPNALGGVYSGAGISAYSGQVVSKPTIFPFARGIGLMGEAGPEVTVQGI